jgi:hypothetical protein
VILRVSVAWEPSGASALTWKRYGWPDNENAPGAISPKEAEKRTISINGESLAIVQETS